jgi:hypothetical protein
MTIKAHFDGKVIVPDEPVSLPVDQPLVIQVSNGVTIIKPADGRPATVGEMRRAGVIGAWKHRTDITDSTEFVRELRNREDRRGERS